MSRMRLMRAVLVWVSLSAFLIVLGVLSKEVLGVFQGESYGDIALRSTTVALGGAVVVVGSRYFSRSRREGASRTSQPNGGD